MMAQSHYQQKGTGGQQVFSTKGGNPNNQRQPPPDVYIKNKGGQATNPASGNAS